MGRSTLAPLHPLAAHKSLRDLKPSGEKSRKSRKPVPPQGCNLSQHPTPASLAALLAAADDARRNLVAVHHDGMVEIAHLIEGDGHPVEHDPDVRFYTEVYDPGNASVGPVAAENDEYVATFLDWLVRHWEGGSMGLLES